MPPPPLPAARLRRLSSRRLRETFNAPELERYLARQSIDLAVTNELEAVRVRVLRGVEVLQERTLTTLATGLAQQVWTLAAAGVAAGALVALVLADSRSGSFALVLGILASAGLVAASWRLVRLRQDLRTLRQLHRRYRRAVTDCADITALTDLAQRIYDEACLIGDRRAGD